MGRVTLATELLDRIGSRIDQSGFVAHGVHVRVDEEAAERRWTPDVREEIHSVAKAVAVLAVGIARDEGLVDPDEIVAHDYTLRDLLRMTSGVDYPWSPTMFDDADVYTEFLAREPRGRVFQYANASTYVAMRTLAARVGDVEQWLQPRLFAPLGWTDVEWRRCPDGHVLAGEGISLTTEEMSRLGVLLRDGGVYEGRRLVAKDWVRSMHTDWFEREAGRGYEGYALGAWRGPGQGWRLHGAYGQMILFRPDAVVTISADDHFGADELAAFVMS